MADRKQQQLEAAILAALVLIYRGKARAALDRMGRPSAVVTISTATQTRLETIARERAESIVRGTGQRIDQAHEEPPEGEPSNQNDRTVAAVAGMRGYNARTLIPYIAGLAGALAVSTIYDEQTDDHGRPMKDAVQWVWTQNTDNPDLCSDSSAASPASYDFLVATAGGAPPVHQNCQCSLDPNI